MKYIHKRKEGDQVYTGINWMIEPGYIGLYIRFTTQKHAWVIYKLRIRTKEYAKKCDDGKRIYFNKTVAQWVDPFDDASDI